VTYSFNGLVEVMAKATPLRSGDELAGCAAHSDAERAAAQQVLADTALTVFLEEMVIPYEDDEVTRLIIDSHDRGRSSASRTCPWARCATGCSTSPQGPIQRSLRQRSPVSAAPSRPKWPRP
jgi:ethanolamine ammonia-lyase large subunit